MTIKESILEEELKKLKLALIMTGSVETCMYMQSTTPEKARVKILPTFWDNRILKRLHIQNIKETCSTTCASEFLLIGVSEITCNKTSQKTDALIVFLERTDGIRRVTLPFKYNSQHQLMFGEESWDFRDTKDPLALMEGFIQ